MQQFQQTPSDHLRNFPSGGCALFCFPSRLRMLMLLMLMLLMMLRMLILLLLPVMLRLLVAGLRAIAEVVSTWSVRRRAERKTMDTSGDALKEENARNQESWRSGDGQVSSTTRTWRLSLAPACLSRESSEFAIVQAEAPAWRCARHRSSPDADKPRSWRPGLASATALVRVTF